MPRSTPWLQRMHISACTAAVHARQQSSSRHDSCPAQASGLSRPRVARPAGLQRCRAHGVLRDDATGAGKGVVADMDGVPARIWRQAHLARVGDALRTRRRSDAERLARAVEWHSEAFLRSTRRDPGPGRRSFLTNHRIIQVAATDPSGSPPEARVRTHVDSPMNTEDSQAVYSSTAVKSLLHAASTVPSQLQTTPVTPDQLPRPPTVLRHAPHRLQHQPPPWLSAQGHLPTAAAISAGGQEGRGDGGISWTA